LAIYKTVLIIFPLNLQTITITLDVVKWRGGEISNESGEFSAFCKLASQAPNVTDSHFPV